MPKVVGGREPKRPSILARAEEEMKRLEDELRRRGALFQDKATALEKLREPGFVAAELRGDAVYVSGDTFPIKDDLKALGCRWSPNFREWQCDRGALPQLAKIVKEIWVPRVRDAPASSARFTALKSPEDVPLAERYWLLRGLRRDPTELAIFYAQEDAKSYLQSHPGATDAEVESYLASLGYYRPQEAKAAVWRLRQSKNLR